MPFCFHEKMTSFGNVAKKVKCTQNLKCHVMNKLFTNFHLKSIIKKSKGCVITIQKVAINPFRKIEFCCNSIKHCSKHFNFLLCKTSLLFSFPRKIQFPQKINDHKILCIKHPFFTWCNLKEKRCPNLDLECIKGAIFACAQWATGCFLSLWCHLSCWVLRKPSQGRQQQ